MTEAQYDSLHARGQGLCTCHICREPTWFTHDGYGDFFCISCGHDAETARKEVLWPA